MIPRLGKALDDTSFNTPVFFTVRVFGTLSHQRDLVSFALMASSVMVSNPLSSISNEIIEMQK